MTFVEEVEKMAGELDINKKDAINAVATLSLAKAIDRLAWVLRYGEDAASGKQIPEYPN